MRLKSLTPRRWIGWAPFLVVLLATGILGAIRDERLGGDIAWSPNFAASLQLAKTSRKPMLVCFHSPSCGWCEKLDAETFTDPRVLELTRRYVCVRVESDVDPDVVEKYGVSAFPTVLVIDPNGAVTSSITGYLPADKFVAALK